MHRILYGWGELSRSLFVSLLQNMFEVMNYLAGAIRHWFFIDLLSGCSTDVT